MSPLVFLVTKKRLPSIFRRGVYLFIFFYFSSKYDDDVIALHNQCLPQALYVERQQKSNRHTTTCVGVQQTAPHQNPIKLTTREQRVVHKMNQIDADVNFNLISGVWPNLSVASS